MSHRCLRAIALLFVPALVMATTPSAPAGFRIALQFSTPVGEAASVTLRCTDGTLVTLLGTLGKGMRPPDEPLDGRADIESGTAAPAPELWPFRLELDPPGGDVTFRCFEGCAWTRLSLSCGKERRACPTAVDQNGTAK